MTHERLSPTDASFLYIESDHEPQHVGSLAIIEGGPLRDESGRIRIDDLRETIARRIHRVPRMRQRVRFVPFRQGRPVWVDDHRFDLTYHVRLTSLPRPGTREQLLELMGRLQSLPLDRSRPLWEIWVVDGLADDRVAQIIKTHHAVGDGIANVDMVMALVDTDPHPPPDPEPPSWEPAPPPGDLELWARAVAEQVVRPATLARSATAWVRHPSRAVEVARDVVSTLVAFGDRPARAPWNTGVSPHRRWVDATVTIDQVRRIRKGTDLGATLNDVVLAACAGALRDLLESREGRVAPDRRLSAMVPVSRRDGDDHGSSLGNRVSLIVADLPVGEPDPLRRLAAIRRQTADRKGSGMTEGSEALVGLSGELPMLAPELAWAMSRSIPMNLVITNVPGPPVPLWVYGARVVEAYPYVEVIDREGLTIAVLSYEGRLHFGITADRDVMPDLADLAAGIEHHVHLLEELAG